MPFRLRVLGPVTVWGGDDDPATSRITQPLQLALLVYLALARPRGLQSRDHVMSLLWPRYDAAQARRALRNALHGLRNVLGPEAVLSVGASLIGLDAAAIRCDAYALESGTWPSSDWPTAIGDSTPLDGLVVSGSAPFDEWVDQERRRLRELLSEAATASRPVVGNGSAGRAPRPIGPHAQDAYALYVRGHYCFLRAAHDGDPRTLDQSRAHFERALAVAPDFAPALAGKANYHAVAARRGLLAPFDTHFARCLELATRALALDDTLAVPHVHFGVEAMYLTDDWARAGQHFSLATQKDPTYAEGHRFLSIWLGVEGRLTDALAAAEHAAALEPDIVMMLSTLGAARAAVGDVAGAEAVYGQALALDPRHAPARERMLRLLEAQGRFPEALGARESGGPHFRAAAFREAWMADGADGYRAARTDELMREADAMESRLVERNAPTVSDRFAPSVLRLVAALLTLGQPTRARAWQLQATAERPGLARWFAALPEVRAAATARSAAR